MLRRIALLACLALSLGAAAPSPAVRQVAAQARDRERERAQALEDAEAARAEIAGLNAELAEFDRAQQAGQQSVSGKRLKLAALTAQEADLDARLGSQRAETARLLAVLAIFRRDPPPALFVNPHDVKDAVRAEILIRAITPVLEARARALEAQIHALRETRREAALASEDLFTAESDVAQQRAAIEALIRQKTQLEQQAEAEAKDADEDIAALSARTHALSTLASAAPAAAVGPAPPDPEHAGLFGRPKRFIRPVNGEPVLRFGAPEPGGLRSVGWTWRAGPSAAIAAPADAVVDFAGPLKGWGVVVILRLGGAYRVVVAGLETSPLQIGQYIKAGQSLGQAAPAGGAADIHVEIRKNGVTLDPQGWF